MYISAEERGSAPIDGLIGIHLNSLFVERLMCLCSPIPKFSALSAANTATAWALVTKYEASSTGKTVVMGTTAAPVARTANTPTVNSYPPGASTAMYISSPFRIASIV